MTREADRRADVPSRRSSSATCAPVTLEPTEHAQTAKRDFLLDLERKYQAEWQRDRVFEVDAPSTDGQWSDGKPH